MSESSSFLDQRNEAFREVHSGPTKNDFSVKVDESVYREAMTLKDAQEKNRQTVDDLFKQEEIGSVFEKGQKLEEKALSNEKNDIKSTTNNGIDSRGLESIRQESSAQDKTIQHSSVGSNFGL
jgi:hypothetical protein